LIDSVLPFFCASQIGKSNAAGTGARQVARAWQLFSREIWISYLVYKWVK
jgi:hypothetical protein